MLPPFSEIQKFKNSFSIPDRAVSVKGSAFTARPCKKIQPGRNEGGYMPAGHSYQ
jgi:hypothetical protein